MTTLDGPRLEPADGGAARQLVVLCHGVGADGHDLIGLAPTWSHAVPSAAFAAPSAPEPYDRDPHGPGRQWFSVADRTPSVMARGVRTAAALLGSFIDAELERLALPATAYVLMGFSQGAMTVLFTGLRRPAAPQAILAYSGALLAPETLESELRNRAPVLLVHGEADDVVPVVRSRDAERDLRAAGVPVEAHYMPGLGHGIDEDGIRRGGVFLRNAFGEE